MKQYPTGVPALERALKIVRHLSRSGASNASAQELQQALRVPRVSLYRLLHVLTENGFVTQDADGTYRLGTAMMALGFYARETSPLVAKATPLLRQITQQTRQMSELVAATHGWQLITLEVWQAERTPLRFRARAGMVFSLNAHTAHGLCHLGFGSDRHLAEYMKLGRTEAGRSLLGIHSAPSLRLPEQCALWRRLGYAWLRQSHPNGKARLAVPVFDPHSTTPRVAATLCVSCDSNLLNALQAARWAPVLQTQARELERRLAK